MKSEYILSEKKYDDFWKKAIFPDQNAIKLNK